MEFIVLAAGSFLCGGGKNVFNIDHQRLFFLGGGDLYGVSARFHHDGKPTLHFPSLRVTTVAPRRARDEFCYIKLGGGGLRLLAGYRNEFPFIQCFMTK